MYTIGTSGALTAIHAAQAPPPLRGLTIDPNSREVHLDGRIIHLTRTEFDLLRVLHRNPRQVFTPRQLFSAVWTSDFFDADHVIETHVSRLRRKLGESGTHPRFIHTVRGVGYRFEPESPRVPPPTLPSPEQAPSADSFHVRLSPDLSVREIDPALADVLGITCADGAGRNFPELLEHLAGSTLLEFQTRPIRDSLGRLTGIEVRLHLQPIGELALETEMRYHIVEHSTTWRDHARDHRRQSAEPAPRTIGGSDPA